MDKVGINAPSGNVIHFKSVERAAELFGERGWDVTIGEDVYTSFGRFGGSSDSARLNDFSRPAATPNLFCALGAVTVFPGSYRTLISTKSNLMELGLPVFPILLFSLRLIWRSPAERACRRRRLPCSAISSATLTPFKLSLNY